jgi:hypothetical protein
MMNAGKSQERSCVARDTKPNNCVTRDIARYRCEIVSNLGVIWAMPKTAGRGNGMKWRVVVELTGSDGTAGMREITMGSSNPAKCSAGTVGLTLRMNAQQQMLDATRRAFNAQGSLRGDELSPRTQSSLPARGMTPQV